MISLRRGSAFTLVELLIVIAIIALLMGILLPVLSRARRSAEAVKCASNMRQVAAGWLMYAESHGGVLVPARMPNLGAARNVYWVGNGETYRPRWYALMGAQTGLYCYLQPSPLQADENIKDIDDPVFLCPGVPEYRNSRHYTYGYNHQFLGNARNKDGTPSGTVNPINYPVNLAKISTGETVMFADSMGTAAGKPAIQRHGYNSNGNVIDNYAVGNHAFTLDPPRLTPDSDRCDDNHRRVNGQDNNRSAPDPRHNGRANVAFCDGHVEAMALKDMGYVVNADGSVAAMDPAAHNKFFSGDGTDRDPPPVK
jgi:prepilin-type processing-associated H-X9-DG protein/prepilin-type N-terminal cleavage/methylation domain-containing protein